MKSLLDSKQFTRFCNCHELYRIILPSYFKRWRIFHVCNISFTNKIKKHPRKVTPSTTIQFGGALKCILLPTLTRLKTPHRRERSKNDYVIKLFTVLIFFSVLNMYLFLDDASYNALISCLKILKPTKWHINTDKTDIMSKATSWILTV